MFSEGVSESYKSSINDFYQETLTQFISANINLAVSLYDLKHANDKTFFDQVLSELRSYKVDLNKYLSPNKIQNLLDHYTEVIDSCLVENPDFREYYFDQLQPKELVRFCSKLMNLKEKSEVYYPFIGMGSFAIENPSCYYYGEEESLYIWALRHIYFDAHNISSDITFKDPFLVLQDKMDMSCENIILTPSLSLKGKDYDEYDTLYYALKSLRGDGKLLAILPSSFCTSHSSKCSSLREYLVENHYLSTVVTLPNMYYPHSGVTICVLLIDKRMTEEPFDSFTLVDGRSFVKGKNFILDADGLLEAINNGTDKTSIVRLTSYDLDDNYNLMPSRYLLDTTNIEDGIKLSELVDLYPTSSYNGDMWIVSNFSDDWNKCNLTLSKSENNIRRRVFINDGNCMMVQYSNNRLMIGVVEDLSLGEKIAVGALAIAFHIKDPKRISKKYLLYALKSKDVMIQAQAMAAGVTIPRLSFHDFLRIVIPCPDRLKQDEIIQKAEDKYLQQLGLTRTSSDIAHMLGTPSVHIGNALKLLSLSENLDESDRETLAYLKDNFEYMDRLVKLNSILDFSKMEMKPICLADFIRNYVAKWKSFGANTFKVSLDFKNGVEGADVSANLDALMIMFDCLFDNANRHGFHKEKSADNEMTITLSIDDGKDKDGKQSLVMHVGNNGTPPDKDFTVNDYITRGRFKSDSGRSGLGGYHVNAVVQSMGGELSSILIMEGWTDFVFRIPIINVDKLDKFKSLQK